LGWAGTPGANNVSPTLHHSLTPVFLSFCPLFLFRGDLEVFYPELGDVGCTYIPKCNQYRKRISKEWHSPKIAYPQADKKYVLIMVDPDAPNRANPKYRFWRHWVVIDIKPHPLCFLCPDYGRPTPPSQSGYHRYQFRLYEQPAHEAISLSPEEKASLGSWPLERFVEQFRLGSPVASTQFLTQHHTPEPRNPPPSQKSSRDFLS
uniref:Phosphatidylethanolamine binding protein 4 n=1 Tax=Gopherus evgoodei TaxID=1825980 RepID=A0A8C4WP43_9SAUR